MPLLRRGRCDETRFGMALIALLLALQTCQRVAGLLRLLVVPLRVRLLPEPHMGGVEQEDAVAQSQVEAVGTETERPG